MIILFSFIFLFKADLDRTRIDLCAILGIVKVSMPSLIITIH